MNTYRYSEWDGEQGQAGLDKDVLLGELERNLTAAGDLASAMWKMQREGIDAGEGERLAGNRELVQRLEEKRRELLERYDFTAAARAIRRQLEKISDAEEMTGAPEDIARQLDALRQHRFTNPEARDDFKALLEALRSDSLEPLGGGGSRPAGTGGGAMAAARTRPTATIPSLQETLELLALLQKMDRLESQLNENQRRHTLGALDPGLAGEVLGGDIARGIQQLRRLDALLRDAGYLRDADKGPELTPRAIRRIGERALQEIYAQARDDLAGSHDHGSGSGGMKLEESRKYEFGDDFNLHLLNTVMNAIRRAPRKPPLALTPDDFETVKAEAMTRAATVLLLDLSRSMPRHGNFQAAKRVALALAELIRTRYPTDRLYILGFSTYARRIAPHDLAQLAWDSRDRHTNIQHGLRLARQLLGREANADKHVILITDGEPTTHVEGGRVFSQYPPTARTRQVTLGEVRGCIDEGIELSAFIFQGAEFGKAFVDGLARSRCRLFFASAATLGRYLLVDYIGRRSKSIT